MIHKLQKKLAKVEGFLDETSTLLWMLGVETPQEGDEKLVRMYGLLSELFDRIGEAKGAFGLKDCYTEEEIAAVVGDAYSLIHQVGECIPETYKPLSMK